MQRLLAILSKVDPRDVFVFGGILLTAIGAGMIYLPAALICAGMALLFIGIFGVPTWH